MDNLVFDYTTTSGNIVVPPVQDSSQVVFDESKVIAQQGLVVGDIATTGYSLPNTLGTNGYILVSNVATNSLVWIEPAAGGGGGNITNGGNSGPVLIGTTDATDTSIISGSGINIGQTGTANQISLNGSVGFQYNNINTALGTLNLNADYFFIEVTNAGTNTVALPDASSSIGRQYIISKGFSGGTLTITTTASDTIDGSNPLVLTVLDQRIQLISNNLNKWLIL